MWSNIASFFWGNTETTSAEEIFDVQGCLTDNESLAAVPTIISDDETEWVMVNKKLDTDKQNSSCDNLSCAFTDSKSEKATKRKRENKITESKKERKQKKKINVNSALQSSNVLVQALKELKPQHKAVNRQRENENVKQLERSNKVQKVNGASNRPKRRNSMYKAALFSRAVNNRKC